jgi:hypothetical protein
MKMKPTTPLSTALRLWLSWLKLLLDLEKHGKANDGAVDQQAANDAHEHGLGVDEQAVGEDGGEGW